MVEKKTANMKKYQADYAKANPRDHSEYMKDYIKNAVDVECPICKAAGLSGHYKTYAKYRHDATKKHKTAELLLEAKNELAKREKEQEEAQAAALAKEAEKKNKPKIRINKKKEAEKEKEKEKPKKKEENIKMEVKEKVSSKPDLNAKEKAAEKKKEERMAALKELESSSSESEEEEEKLEDTVFYFQSKEIDAEKVAEYIEEHHEKSVKPDRAPDTKTKRLNKNASLWRKVSKELDGKKWSYVGENFGKIIQKSYEKPSSQADLVQMLKLVVIHFTKVPVGEQKAISALARKLKETHTAKGK